MVLSSSDILSPRIIDLLRGSKRGGKAVEARQLASEQKWEQPFTVWQG